MQRRLDFRKRLARRHRDDHFTTRPCEYGIDLQREPDHQHHDDRASPQHDPAQRLVHMEAIYVVLQHDHGGGTVDVFALIPCARTPACDSERCASYVVRRSSH